MSTYFRICGLSFLALLAFCAFSVAESGPVLEGKAVEDWARSADEDFDAFSGAVQRWGLQGVPHWVRLLGADRTTPERTGALRALEITLRDQGVQKIRRVAEEVAVPAMLPLLRDKQGFIRSRTMNVFRALGPGAKAAIPELLAILRDVNDPDASRFATRKMAALALGDIREQPDLVVPALCEAMNDQDPQLRHLSVTALGTMSWRAKAAIALIEAEIPRQDAEFQRRAEESLVRIRRPAPPAVGDLLPEFEMPRVLGTGMARTADLVGSVVVLEFWAASCPPCQQPMTKLDGLTAKRDDWRGKVALVGISVDETLDRAAGHAKARGWKSMELWFDPGARVHEQFRANLPETIVVDRTGKIAWRGHPTDISIEAEVDRLLR